MAVSARCVQTHVQCTAPSRPVAASSPSRPAPSRPAAVQPRPPRPVASGACSLGVWEHADIPGQRPSGLGQLWVSSVGSTVLPEIELVMGQFLVSSEVSPVKRVSSGSGLGQLWVSWVGSTVPPEI